MIQLADAQRIARLRHAFPFQTAAADLQHARRTVHADDAFRPRQEAGQHGPGAAAQIHGGAALLRHCGRHTAGKIEIAQHLMVELVPVFRNGIEELPGLAGPFLQDMGRHAHIGPHGGVRRHEGRYGLQEVMGLSVGRGRIEHPEPVPARAEQARLGQDLEVA